MPFSFRLSSVAVAIALFAVMAAASFHALREFRAAGVAPAFYQSNFESAVLMACGRGFGTAQPQPAELRAFLDVQQDHFDCASLPATMTVRPLTTAAHATWYYLYGTAAMVWRVTGISWTGLDALVGALSGGVAVLLFGLFRLFTAPVAAATIALILTLSPSNLTALLSLRDYSKAPFVLAGILILAVLILRPLSRTWTFVLAGLYGAVVGLGYGFRGDLAIMVPFGALVLIALLPPLVQGTVVRNALAATIMLAGFAVLAFPVLSGLRYGGCQFHFALLGLTNPLTTEMRLTPPLYRLGDHLTDTFADLKVGDYSARVMGAPPPSLCSADYDTASGGLFREMALTFPADLTVRAYASVLMILRVGLMVPDQMSAGPPFPRYRLPSLVYGAARRVTGALAPLGPILTLGAIAIAFGSSVRIGLALTLFVLFLTGYPAIQFEERHWFHLRFIPWLAAVIVAMELWRWRGTPRPRSSRVRAIVASAALMVGLAAALGLLRMVQERFARNLIASYLVAPTETMVTARRSASSLGVQWEPVNEAQLPFLRGSDLVVVTLQSGRCGQAGPAAVRVTYAADLPGHDLATTIPVPLAVTGDQPTRLFVPVFWQGLSGHTDLKFSGFEMIGAPVDCIAHVARVTDRASLPLWLQVQVPADWQTQGLYQSMRAPRLWR